MPKKIKDIELNEKLYDEYEGDNGDKVYLARRQEIKKIITNLYYNGVDVIKNKDLDDFFNNCLDEFDRALIKEPKMAKECVRNVVNEEITNIKKSRLHRGIQIKEYTPLLTSISAVLLSFISIFITFGISKNQEEVMKLAYMPVINVSRFLELDRVSNSYNNEHYEVRNYGYSVRNIKVSYKTYMNFSIIGEGEVKYLPVSYFRGTTKVNENNTKIIILGDYNNSHFFSILNALSEYNNHEENGIYTEIHSLFKITYTDVSGEEFMLFYKDEDAISSAEYVAESENLKNMEVIPIESVDISKIKELLHIE